MIIIATILAMTGYSCKEKGGKHINQGEIHYTIEYRGNFGSIPTDALPKNLIISFKENKFLFEMLSVFGNSGIINLSNSDEDIFDTYFSLFTIRYYYAGKKGEAFPGLMSMDNLEIRKTSETFV